MSEPYVFQRARSPFWWGRFMFKGKYYCKALDRNKKTAQAKLKKWRDDVKSQKLESWSNFKTEYFAWAAANKKEKTVYRDRLSLTYLEEFKPDIRYVTDVTPVVLDKFKAYLILKARELEKTREGQQKRIKRRGMGKQGINRTLQSIKSVLRKAESWKLYAEKQEWATVSKIKVPRGRVVFHTVEELRALVNFTLEIAETKPLHYCPWTTVILLGARAGLRRGEIHNLIWTDINWDKNVITIQPKEDWAPKNYECRDIPMTDDLRAHLLTIPRRGDYVLYSTRGERFSIDSLTTYYRLQIAKKVGLESFIHKLRHTFASHLVQNRVDLFTVKELMGHKNILTTQIYAHLSPDTLQTAVTRLPSI